MARRHSSHWSMALLASADIPFSVLLGLLGVLRNGENEDAEDGPENGARWGMCILRVLACVFALVGGVTAFCATLGATRAGFWRVYIHERVIRARAVAILGALAFYFLSDWLSRLGFPNTTPTSPTTTSTLNLDWLEAAPTSFFFLGAASAGYAKLYSYFLSQTGWYIKREAALDIFLPKPSKAPSAIPGRLRALGCANAVLNGLVGMATVHLTVWGNTYMLDPETLCLLQAASMLLFTVPSFLEIYTLKRWRPQNFWLGQSIVLPLRAVVTSFTVGALAWSVLNDSWARECAGGVLVVSESEECMRGLWVRIAPLIVWVVTLAHAALTISTLNAYTAFTQQRASFVASLRDLNRETCRLARSEGYSCRRCACGTSVEDGGELSMDRLDEDGDFVLVVDAGQGAREVLVRGRNLEAEVAALDRELLFTVEEGCEEEEDVDEPLLSGPVPAG
ncbi:hypothetical protein PENSPDRAFT_749502 [Peniophora sp. CONT]|nr:hypothetical protein PENSPDRAFT_749502 [Peniophora sp. CONT]